jgi:hypothetical protein
MDAHGADGKGNPIGGLVLGRRGGKNIQFLEWTEFISECVPFCVSCLVADLLFSRQFCMCVCCPTGTPTDAFCSRACLPSSKNGPANCQHICSCPSDGLDDR